MENSALLDVPFAMGVGGTFDVLAGKVRRAPRAVQKAGLEWAFRLAQEPRRLWKRYLVSNSRFLIMILRARLARSAASRAA
jgi:N-acetylglucosaminyldiphosphoundecaprenol N-acetyl-beta-D-mannosaminyltransferase